MGQHSKPNDTTTTMKKIALGTTVGLGAVVVPAAFAGPASAASADAWDRIAACESGDMNVPGSGRWNLPYGDADSTGGLQIQLRTWNDFGGQQYAAAPYLATKEQQIAVAEKILATQGPSAWVCNAPGHGIASGALDGQSADTSGNPPVTTPPPAPDPAPAPKPKPHRHGHGHAWGHWKRHGHRAPAADHYIVRDGDTLYGITKALTGNKALDNWKPLYNANVAVIGSDPDLILPGQRLILPWATGQADPPTGSNDTPPPAPDPAPKPDPAPATDGYVAPVKYTYVGDGLIVGSGGSMSRANGGHSGLDLIAPMGTKVVSVAAGTVVSINASGSAYGNHVVVKHADGKYTLYAHLSAISVSLGDSVAAGQQVGLVGATGNASGPHLHFEVRTDPTAFNSGIFLDPKAYLAAHGVTL